MERRKYTILLIDDDEDDYILTRETLAEIEENEFELEWVETATEALTAIEHRRHDVYLLDYRLGRNNGLEILREALARGCNAPIILLTGQGDHSVDLEAMQAGAADYMVKGELNSRSLERAIRYAIERKRAESEHQRLLERAEEARKEAEAANRAKDEFLGILSHELRTPINIVLGWTKLLRTPGQDAQTTAQGLEALERNALAQTRLIEDLLDVSQVITGNFKLDISQFDLATTIN